MNRNIQEIGIWHIIDGKWAHIHQRYIDGHTEYYTNGKLELTIPPQESTK